MQRSQPSGRTISVSAVEQDLVAVPDVALELRGALAVRAHDAHETLREHRREGVGDDPRLDAEIDEAHDRLDRVRRVERREHEVAGEGRLHRDPRRLRVAHLADEDDVRILPKDGAQARRRR